MAEKMQQTREMLEKHHRDGEQFAELMKQTFEGRFNDEFWQAWQQWMAPVMGESAVVLDLGTGPGRFLTEIAARYPGTRAIGVECAEYMINAVPAGSEIIEADLHDPHLPLADGSVDAVMAAVVLHEMHQPVRTLQEMQRCLKSGGRFCVLDWVRAPLQQYLASEEQAVFDPAMPLAELEDTFIHFIEHNRFSADDLAFMLEQTGFKVLDITLLKNGQFARLIAEKR